jgi:hypothetical protein
MLALGGEPERHVTLDDPDVRHALELAAKLDAADDPVEVLEPYFDDLVACLSAPKVRHSPARQRARRRNDGRRPALGGSSLTRRRRNCRQVPMRGGRRRGAFTFKQNCATEALPPPPHAASRQCGSSSHQ